MSNLFNMDNPFFRFMGHVADLVILNFICLVCCIPIVTIGASVTAAYYVAMKKVRGEETYIVKTFFHSFKENFKQSTVIWLVFLILGILMTLDFRIVNAMEGTLALVMCYALMIVAVITSMIFLYVFPVLARFYNPIKATLKNALLMSIRHLPYTILMLAITVGSVLLTFLNTTTFVNGLFVWILLGVALIIFINAYFFRKIFDHYLPAAQEEAVMDESPLLAEEVSKKSEGTPILSENDLKNEK